MPGFFWLCVGVCGCVEGGGGDGLENLASIIGGEDLI